MKIHLLAIGARMPDWVEKGYAEYAGRLPRECALHLLEIPAGKRGSHADLARLIRAEGERLLAAVPTGSRLIALDERGQEWNTVELAEQLSGILTFMEQLNEVDVTGVEPMVSVTPMRLKRRADVVTDGNIQAQVLKNAPEAREGFFAVPKVVE